VLHPLHLSTDRSLAPSIDSFYFWKYKPFIRWDTVNTFDIIHHELLHKLYNSTILLLSVYILGLDALWKVCAVVDHLIVALTQVISHWSCCNGVWNQLTLQLVDLLNNTVTLSDLFLAHCLSLTPDNSIAVIILNTRVWEWPTFDLCVVERSDTTVWGWSRQLGHRRRRSYVLL